MLQADQAIDELMLQEDDFLVGANLAICHHYLIILHLLVSEQDRGAL